MITRCKSTYALTRVTVTDFPKAVKLSLKATGTACLPAH